ncbi:MAG: putative colanic acid biosynthesis acetyltransferase [Planctomycetota bacterium]
MPPEARHVSPYRFAEKLKRLVWTVVEATAFRWTWPTWYGYRAWLLRRFGADIHPDARIRRTCRFTCPWNLKMGANTATGDRVIFYCLGPVTVGERVTISQYAHLCAGSHDFTDPVLMPLLRPPIAIEDDAWIATDAFVGPNVTVGEGALLGARGCAFKDLKPWTIYGGNPAKELKPREVKTNAETTDNDA